MPARPKRDQIVATALELFYRDGFHATGIDKIIKTAEVSKKTLYNHFKSKDELVQATLLKRDELFRIHLINETERLADNPRDRLLSVFDVLNDWFHEHNFSGCMFINASAEFAETGNANHILCAEHKRLVREYVKELAVVAGIADAEELSKQLNILMEGAIVDAYVTGDLEAAKRAKGMARVIIGQTES